MSLIRQGLRAGLFDDRQEPPEMRLQPRLGNNLLDSPPIGGLESSGQAGLGLVAWLALVVLIFVIPAKYVLFQDYLSAWDYSAHLERKRVNVAFGINTCNIVNESRLMTYSRRCESVVHTSDKIGRKKGTFNGSPLSVWREMERSIIYLRAWNIGSKVERIGSVTWKYTRPEIVVGILDGALLRRSTYLSLTFNRLCENTVSLRDQNGEFYRYISSYGVADVFHDGGKVKLALSQSRISDVMRGHNGDLNPRTVGSLKLLPHDSNLLLSSSGLLPRFTKTSIGEDGSNNNRDESSGFYSQSPLVSAYFPWAITILGCVIICYGYWQGHMRVDIALGWWLALVIIGMLVLGYGFNAVLDRAGNLNEPTDQSRKFALHAGLGGRFIGGALMTCLRSLRKFRYSRVFLMSCSLSSSTLSFGFGSCDITPPPDWSGYSKSDASRRPIRVLCGSVPHPWLRVRCSGMTAHRGI
jgi:hypothetical protein